MYLKIIEIAVEINKLETALNEKLDRGNLLNTRQRLFDIPENSLESLNLLMLSFVPYKKLWLTAAEFTKWREAWTLNPLRNVDPKFVEKSTSDYKELLTECLELFHELPKLKAVAEKYLKDIEIFEPSIYFIKHLRNPAWQVKHWIALQYRSKMNFKYDFDVNFDSLLRLGIMDHSELIETISLEANQDMIEYIRASNEAEQERLKQEDAAAKRRLRLLGRSDVFYYGPK